MEASSSDAIARGEQALKELFGSQARARLLSWLCGWSAEPLHLRAIARQCGLPYNAARREVTRLERLGLVRAEQVGRSKRYHLIETHPLLPGLRQLVRYAVGIVPRLRELLADEPVEVAFIFGSLATGENGASSDVDLMVIGEIDSLRVSALCREAERDTNREITPVTYQPGEFREKVKTSSSFLSSVLRKPKIFVRGDEGALQQLVA